MISRLFLVLYTLGILVSQGYGMDEVGYVERTLTLPTLVTVVHGQTYAPIPNVKVTYFPRMKPRPPVYDDFGEVIKEDLGLGEPQEGMTDAKGQIHFKKTVYEVEPLEEGFTVILGRFVATAPGYEEEISAKNVIDIKSRDQPIKMRLKLNAQK